MLITTLVRKIVGSRNDRILKRYRKTVEVINALEPSIKALSDAQLAAKTNEFKERLQNCFGYDVKHFLTDDLMAL